MEFPLSSQNPQFPVSGPPEGFALVPLHLFLLMASQLPILPGSMTVTTISKPSGVQSLYDRAMICSAN